MEEFVNFIIPIINDKKSFMAFSVLMAALYMIVFVRKRSRRPIVKLFVVSTLILVAVIAILIKYNSGELDNEFAIMMIFVFIATNFLFMLACFLRKTKIIASAEEEIKKNKDIDEDNI